MIAHGDKAKQLQAGDIVTPRACSGGPVLKVVESVPELGLILLQGRDEYALASRWRRYDPGQDG